MPVCKFGHLCDRRNDKNHRLAYSHSSESHEKSETKHHKKKKEMATGGHKGDFLNVKNNQSAQQRNANQWKQVLSPYIDMAKSHVAKRDSDLKAEELRYAALVSDLKTDKGYFVIGRSDVKVATDFANADALHVRTLAKIQSEYAEAILLVRKMVLNVVGLKAIKVPMVQQQNFASTITTGVVNTTANITANNFVDFSTFALIFEEYRIVSGHYLFQSSVPAAYGASTPANAGPIFGVLTYSQITSSLANVAAGYDDSQKHIINMSNLNSGFTDSMQKPETFHYRIPPGVLDDANSSGAGNWTLVANNTTIWGVLRPYCIILSAAVVANAIGGISTVEMEFRMRI